MDEFVELLGSIGATAEQIDQARATRDLNFVTAIVFGHKADRTAAELAAEIGRSADDVLRTYRHLGVIVEDPDARVFRAAEADLLRTLSFAVETVFSNTEGNDLLRIIGSSMARIADAGVSGYVSEVETRLAEVEAPAIDWLRTQLAGADLVEDLSRNLPALVIHHFRQAIERQRVAQSDVASRLSFRFAVGFVDLVGFTSLSHDLDDRELSHLIRAFEGRAHEAAQDCRGRIVKHIGDEVMFTALTADEGADLGAALMSGMGEVTTVPRGGVAFGEVLSRGGDHYGRVVNLASRLADTAVDGEILVDEVMAGALSDQTRIEPAGRRQLKGFPGAVRTWSLLH